MNLYSVTKNLTRFHLLQIPSRTLATPTTTAWLVNNKTTTC